MKKCNACKSAIFAQDVKNADYICPKCHNYFRIHARHRIEMVADEGSFEEWNTDLVTRNPLHYKGYEEKIKMMQEKTGLDEAVLTGSALVHGIKAAIGVCDSRFIMASMGEVVGEKLRVWLSVRQRKNFPSFYLPAQAERECRKESCR